jgi:hypothetical protein
MEELFIVSNLVNDCSHLSISELRVKAQLIGALLEEFG